MKIWHFETELTYEFGQNSFYNRWYFCFRIEIRYGCPNILSISISVGPTIVRCSRSLVNYIVSTGMADLGKIFRLPLSVFLLIEPILHFIHSRIEISFQIQRLGNASIRVYKCRVHKCKCKHTVYRILYIIYNICLC